MVAFARMKGARRGGPLFRRPPERMDGCFRVTTQFFGLWLFTARESANVRSGAQWGAVGRSGAQWGAVGPIVTGPGRTVSLTLHQHMSIPS